MSYADYARTRALTEALLGGQHDVAYNDNPQFRHAIDNLAAMLPAMINGIAQAAEEQEKIHAQMRVAAEKTLPPGFTYNPQSGDIIISPIAD